MKIYVTILSIAGLICCFNVRSVCQLPQQVLQVGYFGDTINIESSSSIQVPLLRPLNEQAVEKFYNDIKQTGFQPIVNSLLDYKRKEQLDDWLFYQLIRRTAQQLSPKDGDYERYTLYKWFLLAKCGYNAQLAFAKEKLLIYVQSDDNIYDIPLFEKEGKQYVCLNIHDFEKIDFEKDQLFKVDISVPGAVKTFSYKVKQIPDLATREYNEKQLVFNYRDMEYRYNIRLNPQMEKMFSNYPAVDFESYFNIPLSTQTYSSLIPALKKKMKGMKQRQGIDYLMHFTRHAFMYENDEQHFGKETRMSPEQTLMNDFSDCDDRVALFYYLVKEIYNLPMIVLVYPSHITLAIEMKKPIGVPVVYNGRKFSVCEPTPQRIELPLGQLMPELKSVAFQVAYEYRPANN